MSYNYWLRIKKHKTLPNMDDYVEKDSKGAAVEHFIALIKEKSGIEVTAEDIDRFVLLQLD